MNVEFPGADTWRGTAGDAPLPVGYSLRKGSVPDIG